jgi:hypothetical protein
MAETLTVHGFGEGGTILLFYFVLSMRRRSDEVVQIKINTNHLIVNAPLIK